MPEGEGAEEVDNTGTPAADEEDESEEVQDEVGWVFVCCGREMGFHE